MPKKTHIEIHNEEVREIMKEIPGWIIRWGLTLLFTLFAILIIGSYFFRYPKVVSASVIITTRNPTVVPVNGSEIIGKAIIPASDIGKIEVGQKVHIKLSGFPYMEFGMLEGRIRSVSLVPEEEGYVAEIELTKGMTSSYSKQLKFIQDMDGIAEIITEEMRLIYRFINPLKSLFDKDD